MWDLPYLLQLLNWFGIMKEGSLLIHDSLASFIVSLTETSHKIAPKICQKVINMHGKRLFAKMLKILCRSDHPILFKFHQLVVKIVVKGWHLPKMEKYISDLPLP